jgi:hypothetical protein
LATLARDAWVRGTAAVKRGAEEKANRDETAISAVARRRSATREDQNRSASIYMEVNYDNAANNMLFAFAGQGVGSTAVAWAGCDNNAHGKHED